MTIRMIELFHIAVPLKTRVKHASHDRTDSENLVVRATLDDGTQGYGEGVPRSYVTGETVETTFQELSQFDFAAHLGRAQRFEDAVRRIESLEMPLKSDDLRGISSNAARCAVEIALLDAYGRRFHRSLGDAIRLADVPGLRLSTRATRVRYSGAITASSRNREKVSAWKMWLYGFGQVKLKVGVDGQDDPSRLRDVRRIVGRRIDLRIDANEAWPVSQVRERVHALLPFRPSVLEQPVKHEDVESLAELRPQLGIPVMLDESLCGYSDAVKAIESRTADLFNIRLSKCGGIFPALRILGLAQRSGLGAQLGCHPGETALLSAAGRHVASHVRGLSYVEGSYDNHILSENLTDDDLTFGYGGWANPIKGPGLGVHVETAALERMTLRRQEIRYD